MPGIGVKQIAHVCVLTKNLQASEHFYTQVIGLRKVFDFTRKGAKMGFYLEAPGRTYVEVFENGSAPFTAQGQVDHLCFEVENLDRAIEVLRAHKIEIRHNKKKLGVDNTWQAWISDPDGTKVELFEYTPDSAQFKGGDREVDW